MKIRINEKTVFRPGMSVTAEIETRSRTNVVSVPIQCVTTRLPKPPEGISNLLSKAAGTNVPLAQVSSNAVANPTNRVAAVTKKASDAPKPIEVVFVRSGERVKVTPVKRGISDDAYVEIVEGLKEGDEVVTGSFRAINRDLEDSRQIKIGLPAGEADKAKTGL